MVGVTRTARVVGAVKKGRLAMAVMLTAESNKQGNHDHRVTHRNVSVRLNSVEPDYELLRAVSGYVGFCQKVPLKYSFAIPACRTACG